MMHVPIAAGVSDLSAIHTTHPRGSFAIAFALVLAPPRKTMFNQVPTPQHSYGVMLQVKATG